MSALQRIQAVLGRGTPDKTPFAPNEDLLARGELTRKLRNRGMGMCTAWTRTYWSGWPNVKFKTRTEGAVETTIWETPAGTVSSQRRTFLSRVVSAGRSRIEVARVEDVEDLDAVIYAIEDEAFYRDDVQYDYLQYDLGQDYLIKVAGPCEPYETSFIYFDDGTPRGLEIWRSVQRDHPDRFAALLKALERREERRFDVIAGAPGEVVCLRGLSNRCDPEAFRQRALPFLRRYVALLHEGNKVLCLKTHATDLSAYVDLIPATGVDVIDGFNPPPVGDLSVREARAAWGDGIVLWVNFPTKVFWEGAQATKDYTRHLLESDPSGALVIGLTSVGTSAIADDGTGRVFKAGMSAILDAIDEF